MHKCYRRNSWLEQRGAFLIEHRRDETGKVVDEVFEIIAVKPALYRMVHQLLRCLGNRILPVVYFVRSAHGRGGLFIGPSYILIGIEDMGQIAERVWANHSVAVYGLYTLLTLGRRKRPDLSRFVLLEVAGFAVAHEMGHWMHAQGGFLVPAWLQDGAAAEVVPGERASVSEEASADYLGARLRAALGWNQAMGGLISLEIGCSGPTCDHPSSTWRLSANDEGFADEQAEQQQRLQAALEAQAWASLFSI